MNVAPDDEIARFPRATRLTCRLAFRLAWHLFRRWNGNKTLYPPIYYSWGDLSTFQGLRKV